MIRQLVMPLVAIAATAAAAGLAACQGCQPPPPAATVDATGTKPTLRLYVVSTVAGALEPCGCTKDQLGGLDHLAAYIASQRDLAPNRLVVGAGPMLFMEPEVKGDKAAQDAWKAEAIAL